MKAHKNNKTKLWDIQFRYTNYENNRVKTTRRGFSTKKEAEQFAREFITTQEGNLNMTFSSFLKLYYEDAEINLREHTMKTKHYIIDKKIEPFFSEMQMNKIEARDLKRWQNSLIKKGYSDTYLRGINSQLNSILNFAERYYNLQNNPCKKVKRMGKSRADKHLYVIWTKEEFLKFSEYILDKRLSYMGFSILFWQGLRISELLCLTKDDIDFEKATMRICKAYQRIDGKDVITPTKNYETRTIGIPKFLLEDIKDYIDSFYRLDNNSRLFPVTRSYFSQEMKRGCKLSGVKKIKVHGLRHSAVSLLIHEMDTFDPLAISERMGHSVEECLKTYSHLYTNKRKVLVNKLDEIYGGDETCQD